MIPTRGVAIPLVDKFGGKRSPDEARIIKEMLEEDVDSFVTANRIDAPAARDLRNEPLEVQLAVLDRGPLSVCTNPSAALIGRIRDAKRGIHEGRGPSLMSSQPQKGQSAGVADSALAITNPGLPASEVDRFLLENRLDQGAVMSFKAESADVQKNVMEQGPLFNCTNPSAALMGRIRAVKMGVQPPPMGSTGGPAPAAAGPQSGDAKKPEGGSGSIEDRLNEEAMKAIQMLNYSEQRDPNVPMPVAGEAIARGGPNRTGPVSREEVDKFISDNKLDDRAAASLRLEPPEVQTVVLERGSLADSINPSAALMGRIAQAKLSAANGTSAPVTAPATMNVPRIERATPQDVDRFVQENNIDQRAAREFQGETMEVQTTVINRGPLTMCTNPSSALLGRIRDAKRFSAMGPGGLGVGYASVPSIPMVRSSPY